MHSDDIKIAKRFIKATKDILSTMAGLSTEVGTPFVKKTHAACGDISAVVGVTGVCSGSIAVSFTGASAKCLVEAMLGDDIQDLEQDMCDAVGEITNMVSGQARAALIEDGLTLQGSTPTIITGKEHTIRHQAKGLAVAIPFKLQGSDFTVEFCFDGCA